QPGNFFGSQAANYIGQAFLASRRTLGSKPQLSQRKVKIVANNENLSGSQFIKIDRRANAAAATVHKRVGTKEQDLLAPNARFDHLSLKSDLRLRLTILLG